ncbi:DMT family transporter [Neisseriaceae bacterium TC5R-5]|nr:DMT family transporter [Neisseriaceae bacterium TC5R-5]
MQYRWRNFRLGSGWIIIASLFFALMGVFVKLGSAHFSTTELVFWRTLMGVIALGGAACWRGEPFVTPLLGRHIQRGLLGYCSLLLYFYAIVHLPLATAVTFNYTSPMFLALLSLLLLRERVPQQAVVGLVLGFIGVVLLLKPAVSDKDWWPALMALGSGLLAGWSYLHVRELSRQGEPEWRVVFYFALVSTLGGVLLMLFESWHPITWANSWLLLGLGVTATIAQLAMTRAYKVGRKLVVANLSYLTVVLSTLLGVWLWGDTLALSTMLAMALIMLSGMLASRR